MARGNGLTRPNQLSDELHEQLQAVIVEAVAGDDDAKRLLKEFFPGHDLLIDRLFVPLSVEAQIDARNEYCDGLARRLAVAQEKSAALIDQLHRQKHAHLAVGFDAYRQAADLARHQAEQEKHRLQMEQDAAHLEAKRKLENAAVESREFTDMMFSR